jgi:hypothetical protein
MIGGVCRKGMRGFPAEYSIAEPSGTGAAQKLKEIMCITCWPRWHSAL